MIYIKQNRLLREACNTMENIISHMQAVLRTSPAPRGIAARSWARSHTQRVLKISFQTLFYAHLACTQKMKRLLPQKDRSLKFCVPPNELRTNIRFLCYGQDYPSTPTRGKSFRVALISPFIIIWIIAFSPSATLFEFAIIITPLNQRFVLWNFHKCIIKQIKNQVLSPKWTPKIFRTYFLNLALHIYNPLHSIPFPICRTLSGE